MTGRYLFTSESVTEGHPDKICDQISDAILDRIIHLDPKARVACETVVTTGLVIVVGEITTKCYVDIPTIVRDTVREIGYDRAKYGFDADTCGVMVALDEQSPDIGGAVGSETKDGAEKKPCSGGKGGMKDEAGAVAAGATDDGAEEELERIGAGDQGLVFGFAVDETPELMPLPIALAHRLARRLADVRKQGIVDYLRPDGKTQVTVEYEDGRPVRVETIVISTQHREDAQPEQIREDMLKHVVEPVVPAELLEGTRYLINPSGRFVVGGPQGDAGLTGRKIIVDTYGGMGRHGGGALSGKDPTKVDRSGAYAARWVAKNIVAAGLASRCEVQVSYAIGVEEPVSLSVDTFGTGRIEAERLVELVREHFDLRPAAIIRDLDLRKPIYKQTAAYGHFGRDDLDLPWERTDKADDLRRAAGLA